MSLVKYNQSYKFYTFQNKMTYKKKIIIESIIHIFFLNFTEKYKRLIGIYNIYVEIFYNYNIRKLLILNV